MRNARCVLSIMFLVVLLAPSFAAAGETEVEFRLVAHDATDTTVDTFQSEEEITRIQSTSEGMSVVKVGLAVNCWVRNVLLDGTPLFERYHEGKYIDRLPKAKRSLAPGEHVLWPGNHVFTVAEDGTIASDDPELVIDGATVGLKAYPVSVSAFEANPVGYGLGGEAAPLPNMTLRDAGQMRRFLAPPEAGEDGKPAPKPKRPVELLPVFDDFAPLTIWLPAHTGGAGYYLHPMGLTFRVGADGVKVGAGEGGAELPGVSVEGWRIRIPLHAYPVRGEEGRRLVAKGVGAYEFKRLLTDLGTEYTNWFPRTDAYELRVSEAGPGLRISGDLTRLPAKAFRIDAPDPATGAQRLVAMELPKQHFAPGEEVRGRLQGLDPSPADRAAQRAEEAETQLRRSAAAFAEAEKALARAEAEIEQQIRAADAARKELAEAKEKAEALRRRLAHFTDREALEAAAAKAAETETAAAAAVEKANDAVARAEAGLRETRDAQPALEQAAAKAVEELDRRRANVEALKKKLQPLLDAEQAAEGAAARANEALTAARKTQTTAGEREEKAVAAVAAARKAVEDAREAIGDTEGKLAERRTAAATAGKQLQAAREALADAKAHLEATAGASEAEAPPREEKQALVAGVEKAEKQLAAREEAHRKANAAVTDAEQALARARKALAAREEAVAPAAKQAESAAGVAADAARAVAAADQAAHQADDAVGASQKRVEDARAELRAAEEARDAAQAAVRTASEAVRKAKKTVTEREQALQQARDAAKERVAALEAARKTATEAKQAVAGFVDRETLDASATEAEDALKALTTRVAEAEANRKAAEAATAEARAAVAAARTAQEAAAADAERLAAEAEALADRNLLAAATPYAELLTLDGEVLASLPVQADGGAATDVRFSLPKVADGVYVLRLGLQPTEADVPPLAASLRVTVATNPSWSLGLFTQRGRDAYFVGEDFWIGVGALALAQEIPAGTPLVVSLVGDDGARNEILRTQTGDAVARGARETWIVRLDGSTSLRIAPGRYRVEAALGDRAALPMPLEMVDPEPATHFACVLNGKYNVMGKQYEDVLKTGEGAPELARNIAGMGYNNFLGMSYTFARSRRHNRRLEDLVRARPALGPWEQYYQPSGRDRFLNEAVRNRLAFRENSFTYNDTSLPRAPKMLDACARFIGMETSSMLHSPAFAGMAIYEEIYWRSLMDPQGIVEAFEQAHELAFREAYPGLTSDRAARALERYVGRPASQRDPRDLEAWRALAAFRDRAWGRFSETNAASIKAVWPASRNTTQTRVFGGKAHIDVNGKAEDVFGPLEVAMFVSYKDGGSGDYPLYSSAMADVLRVRDDLEVWTQLHTFHGAGLFDRHLVRQTFFGLSQKLDGISWFTVAHDFEDPVYTDSRNTVRDVNLRLLTPYGDWFRSLEKGYRKVGIYYSRTASYLQSKKAEKINYQCEGLWLSCYRAGFPADYLKDQHVRDGKAMEYEVIFAPGWAYEGECPQPIIEQLQRLVNAGKTLVVERSSKLPIEGVVRLDTDLDEYDDKRPLQLMKSLDYSTEIVFQRTEQTTAVVRELLGKRIEPAVVHDARLGGDWMQRGAGEVLIVPNWEYVGFTGMYKTRHTAPKVTEFAFPRRPPVCYDVLEMRRQPVEIEGEHMRLRADMRAYPGKIFLFLPAPIGGVDLAASASLQAGGTVQFRVAVRDEAGEEIDASLPVELTLRNPAGDEVRRVYRAASPVFRDAWPLPANGAPGTWTLTARELASGRVATASIAVAKGTPLRASLDEREAWVYDGGRVGAFFADAETPLVIAVEPGQEWVRPVAEQLRDQLAARGVTAEIRSVPEIVRTPGPWHREHPSIDGTRLWRGTVVTPMFLADAPVVALGRRGENRYIESLIDRGALAAPLTDAFPGPGRAVVDWTHRAFSNQYDAVLILANDEAGLRAGVSAALGAAENEGLPTHPGVLEPEADEAAALAEAAPADAPQPGSFRDALHGEDLVWTLDTDADTGRTLVGTYGYGHNLFCLNPDGTLAWKTFLPEHSVFFTKWIDDGKRLVAATGRGYSVFLLDGKTGKVLRKFASTEWPRTHWKEGSVHTVVPIMINRAQRQILVRGRTGLLAVDFDGKKMWLLDRTEAIQSIPAEADPGVSAPIFQASVVLGNLAVSPDGKRIAFGEYYISGTTPGQKPGSFEQVWSYRPRILDAVTGAVLAENTEDPGAMTSPEGWSVSWPDGNEHPLVHKEDVAAPLLPDGSFGAFRAIRGGLLPDGGELLRETTTVVRKRPDGSVAWQRTEPLIRVLSLDRIDARAERLFRCGRDGEIACVDLSNGETLWTAKLPFSAQIRVAPDGRVFAGDLAGHVASFAPDGTEAWRVRLREFHELPAGDYPGYVDAARRRDRDDTPDYYPAGVDRPGDYDGILRMGIEQIADGSFEGKGAWSSESADVVRGAPAREGKQALQLAADQLVTQALGKRVVPNGTYLLEFFYRPASAAAELAAGASLDGPTPAFTASMFRGRPGEWNFGRLAIKAYTDTERLTVGFEAAGDAVAVDAVSLRPVRFPSANLLYYEPLHKLEPTYVEDLRVTYNRIPAKMEEGLMGKNRVSAFKQGENMTATVFTQEDAYLHNGRLDDVGRQWTFGCGNAMGFSVTLTKTAWISHLVLYLNNSTPEMHYRTISIWANNIETRIPEAVAVVRGNSRRFIVVHFPEPIHTDALSILPFQEYKQFRDSLTEVEVYGPLGGPEMGRNKRYSDDPKGWPMLMGGPAHVPSQWPADLVGRYRQVGAMRAGYPALQCGATVTDGVFTWGQADGVVRSLRWPDPEDRHHRYRWGPTWSLGSITPTTTPTRYAGRLLVGSADNKLHAVADNGQHLWSFPTGGRVLSAPVARGDDVYFGSDDGSLYRADVDSGILLWEYEAGGRVRSAPALADGRRFVASFDGRLHAVDAESGEAAWTAPVAKFTRTAPAVFKGRVYLGDEQGGLHAFAVKDGAKLWSHAIKDRISACPAVCPAGILFAGEQGALALVGFDGKVRWTRTLEVEEVHQPVATESQVLVPTSDGLRVLRQSDGAPDPRFPVQGQGGHVVSVVPYGDQICFVSYHISLQESQGLSFTDAGGNAHVWAPAPAEDD